MAKESSVITRLCCHIRTDFIQIIEMWARRMVWVGKDPEDHLVPTPLPWAGEFVMQFDQLVMQGHKTRIIISAASGILGEYDAKKTYGQTQISI